MKNKTKTYLLLVTVLAIWGIIGFKIVSTLNPDVPKASLYNEQVAFNPEIKSEVDTFSVQIVNRDPFLGTLMVKKPKVKTKSIKPKEPLVWVPVIYQGNVNKQASKNKVFVVSINGVQHLMKKGQTIEGITLIKGNNTEIVVSYKGARKTINRA